MEDSDLQSTQSGALIGSNEDLLTEILIRLPVTSILRFKSVSKHWRSLLTHTRFTHRYDNNNNNNLSVSPGLFAGNIYIPFDAENRSRPPFRNLDFYFNRSRVKILQSCNGLLLCTTFHNGAREYYVFNPTTKQLAFIPPVQNHIWSMALAFHPTECVHYKVVCVSALDPYEYLFQIQMYSFDTGKWKICVESVNVMNPDFQTPVYWNGAVHWAPCYHDSWCFKLDVEELQMLPVPEESSSFDEIFTFYFGESRGHLHLILRSKFEDRILNLNVYEMLRDCSGWFVKYRVQFDELPGFPYMATYDSGVVDVVRGKEEEEETFLVLVTSGKVMRYNVHDKSFNEIYSKTDEDYRYHQRPSCHRYIEALSSF